MRQCARSGTIVSIIQVYAFVIVAMLLGTRLPVAGLIMMFPVLILTGMTLSALGMFLSSWIKQLENFAGVMNFLIFPMFFMSSALYPLWRMREGSVTIYELCLLNPFTYVVELIRFTIYREPNLMALDQLDFAIYMASAEGVGNFLGEIAGQPGHISQFLGTRPQHVHCASETT